MNDEMRMDEFVAALKAAGGRLQYEGLDVRYAGTAGTYDTNKQEWTDEAVEK